MQGGPIRRRSVGTLPNLTAVSARVRQWHVQGRVGRHGEGHARDGHVEAGAAQRQRGGFSGAGGGGLRGSVRRAALSAPAR